MAAALCIVINISQTEVGASRSHTIDDYCATKGVAAIVAEQCGDACNMQQQITKMVRVWLIVWALAVALSQMPNAADSLKGTWQKTKSQKAAKLKQIERLFARCFLLLAVNSLLLRQALWKVSMEVILRPFPVSFSSKPVRNSWL